MNTIMRTLICLVATIHVEYKNPDNEEEIIKIEITKVNQKFQCPDYIAKQFVKSKVAMDITDGIPEIGINQAGVLRKELDISLVELEQARESSKALFEQNNNLQEEIQDLTRELTELKNANEILTNQNLELSDKKAKK